jgi:hypothetical protein
MKPLPPSSCAAAKHRNARAATGIWIQVGVSQWRDTAAAIGFEGENVESVRSDEQPEAGEENRTADPGSLDPAGDDAVDQHEAGEESQRFIQLGLAFGPRGAPRLRR